jgi:hypothetical protein
VRVRPRVVHARFPWRADVDDQQKRCKIFLGRSFDLATGARRAWMDAAAASARPACGVEAGGGGSRLHVHGGLGVRVRDQQAEKGCLLAPAGAGHEEGPPGKDKEWGKRNPGALA